MYLKLISMVYAGAAFLQLLDLLDLRLHFSEMDSLWRTWTLYLFLSDAVVAVALWKPWASGELFLIATVLSQMAVFVGWSEQFGSQYGLVLMHLGTLVSYLLLLTYGNKPESRSSSQSPDPG